MNTHWFDLEVSGPVTDDHIEALGDVLTAAGSIDATVQADERGGVVMFAREADDAIRAVISAIEHVTAVGMNVTGVTTAAPENAHSPRCVIPGGYPAE